MTYDHTIEKSGFYKAQTPEHLTRIALRNRLLKFKFFCISSTVIKNYGSKKALTNKTIKFSSRP